MRFPNLSIILVLLLLSSCKTYMQRKEARDDQRQFRKALKSQGEIHNQLYAKFETQPVKAASSDEDAADDPAIWYNSKVPEKSVVFGTNKTAGIHAYDLQGREVQFVPCGKINNIDIRKAIKRGGKEVDILAGSNRTDNSITLFFIGKNGVLSREPDYVFSLGKFIPYGFCLHKTPEGNLNAFVNDKKGWVYQYEILFSDDGKIDAREVRKLKLDSQVEGMVVDDENEKLYVGEENAGVYQFSSSASSSPKGELLPGTSQSNNNIRFDVEGLALFKKKNTNYLLVSSQGNFTYAIIDLDKRKYVSSFKISEKECDGAEETDGLEILQTQLNADFPEGILVVQDGFNFDNNIKMNQNFKYISLGDMLQMIKQ